MEEEGGTRIKLNLWKYKENFPPHSYLSVSQVSSACLSGVVGSILDVALDFLLVVGGTEGGLVGEGLLPGAAGVEGVEARLIASAVDKRRRRTRRGARRRGTEGKKTHLCRAFLDGNGGRPCGPP